MKVILKFHTHKDLWEYKTVTDVYCAQIDSDELKLVCECNHTDLALAINSYNAVVQESPAML